MRLAHMACRHLGDELSVGDGDLLLLGPKELPRKLRAPRDQVEGRLLLPVLSSGAAIEFWDLRRGLVVEEPAVLRNTAVPARGSRAAEAPGPSGPVVSRTSRASSVTRKVAMTR